MIICGLDEAGRGPLAGPVTAGAVILPPSFPIEILNDSKKLSEKKREAAFELIKEKALWGLGVIDHETIDRINILQASMTAMKEAFNIMYLKLPQWCKDNNLNPADYEIQNIKCLADGTFIPPVNCYCECEPKADGKYPEVMAASIIAKVSRDRIMVEYDKLYPEYGYAKHKGYPTKAHKEICKKIGPSPIQRMCFSY
ncbi:MAG: ribonuclease HII [Treponema sp.]|nr:ribonuclease HII [Treponema sp.]